VLQTVRGRRFRADLSAAALLVSVALLAACGGNGGGGGSHAEAATAEAEPEDVIAVETAPVARAPVAAVYSTSTTLRADRQATVIARTAGVIRQLVVEEGDRVDEGQVLAVLEDDEQKIEHERTRADFEIEQEEFARAEELFRENLLSQADHENARREVEAARHAFSRAELELSRTRIRAPFSGQILTRHLDTGATVANGTSVYDIADLDPLYADVNVPERHVARLEPGQVVRLTADASGEGARATIERIAPSVDASTGTVKVTLTVEPGRRLRPGAFVRADVVTDTHDDALVVPRSALVAEGRRWHLFRLGPDGETVEQIEIRLGFEEGDRVEIASLVRAEQALDPGDRVVVVGAPALSDGARVHVIESSPEDADTAGGSSREAVDEPA
jgi:membrane fusion protein (multidrug efflux system)